MSLSLKLGKKYITPVCPVIEPPRYNDDVVAYACDIRAWARIPGTPTMPNCPQVYLLWKISQQQEHIDCLETTLKILIDQIKDIKRYIDFD